MNNTRSGPAPKISVIIPSYKTAHLIATCLDSVFSQTYADFEAIVVNDGSPDTPQLEQALLPYREKIVYIAQPNKRAAGARNTAIGSSRGEFLAFLDSDDSWLPDHLATQMAMFEKDPTLDFVYADGLLLSDNFKQKTFMEKCPSFGEATFEALVVERCQASISTVVVRKSAIIKAGLFDETLMRCDDYDMWLRTAFHGARIGYSKKVQARMYIGRADSLGISGIKMKEAYWSILDKASRTLPLSDAQARLVKNRMAEVKSECLVEEGKQALRNRNFTEARRLFQDANRHFLRPKVRWAIRGLELAPNSAGKLFELWTRLRSRQTR